jgi:putative Mn2+ efflux pump MntP
MSLLDIILLAIALAMDCFTVSIVSGVLARDLRPLRMALLFGLFQALMPLIGWAGISFFSGYLEAVDHWIAFSMLAFIGGRMVWESFGPDEEHHFNPRRLRTQLLLAIATSIDALAVGISFAFLKVSIFPACGLIAGITFTISFAAVLLGKKLGTLFEAYAERCGGIILILIGLRILIEHLFFNG